MADKSRHFELRLSEAEYARIQENMQELGTRNMSAYLRKMALDGYCIQLDTTDIKELVRLLRICSNNLNQYAKVANTYGTVFQEDIISLQIKLDALWTKAKEILSALAQLE